MSEDNNPSTDATQGEAAGQQKAQPGLKIRRIYLKDLSFETPMGVEAFSQAYQPKIDQDLNVQVSTIEEGMHEVVLLITITATIENRVVFLVEVKQAGLFGISGITGPQLSQVINSHCPQILFPYAREAIDAAVTRGSFPALMLPPLNFDAIFAQAVQQASQQKAAPDAAKPE
ncbi:protein-export chaperone SecB [Marinimicrobium sp. ABcell2]|uniref:protein-export chaperone SecB n=1 Tax=Marinimicrobium sp. ABcell2 TaxID=3069751 RepID=UPI0027B39052|nr:protein-export chaperone SecB [Marinimicrobium sp. ABcell2]MDQ2076556.1 protein-export chaperone SecB [Marinimicrobium sp. ABcell2]